MTKKVYWFLLSLAVLGLGYLIVRSIYALPDGATVEAEHADASAPEVPTQAPLPAPVATWTKHTLGPFEASMPEPVRADATSMATTIEDATIVIIQLTRDKDAGAMPLEARALELAKAISVELQGPETAAPQRKKVGSWDGIEVVTTGVIDGKKRVHTAWLCESGPSDAFAVVVTREAGKPVSEAGAAKLIASIRQTKEQERAK